jgi:hypothetical protein
MGREARRKSLVGHRFASPRSNQLRLRQVVGIFRDLAY